jgi:RNA polymerase sigma-70 factor (sigma-E family)
MDLDPSFAEFVSSRSAQLIRTAYLLTGSRADAEDLVQLALVRTARHWEAAREAPGAYTHRVLLNLARDRHRHRTRRPKEHPLEDAAPQTDPRSDHAGQVNERDAILRAVKLLPERQREVVVLRFYADLNVAETAEAIGASEGTVKTHTSRALATLRTLLQQIDTPESEVNDAHR